MKRRTPFIVALCAAANAALAANVTISNLGDLQQFMQQAHNAPYFEGDTVKLTADIDCQGGQFTSGYSRSGTVFKGTFDGQGHKIYNFSNKGSSPGTGNEGKYGVAMFDIARDGAVIKNLTLEGDFDDGGASPDYAAAFVAYAIGKTDGTLGLTLENCHFTGSVTNYRAAAAFVGAAIHGTGAPNGKVLRMKNCTARGTVRSDYSYVVGGLVANGEAVEAEDCSFEGNATCRWTLGGLIGKAVDSSFKRCSFKGALGSGLEILGGKDGGCGGLVGFASNSVFRACSADADIEWNINTDPYDPDGRIDSYNFTADGGAAGVTCGSSAFYDCTAAGTLLAKHGYAGGFVGWTAGAEVFSNCTTSVALQPDARYSNTHGHGGFASTVASTGALFVDCSTSSQGHNIVGGFFNNQHPRKGVKVGRNTFWRCHVENVPAESAGFCSGAWNCTFEGCTVRGGTGDAGFVYSAGRQPDNQWHSEYSYEQTSTYTDCSVHGTRAPFGFVEWSNYSEKDGHTNVFRRCRAGCVYGKSNSSGASSAGFGSTLNKGTLIEDCAAYGIADMGPLDAGFAESISVGATVRRCVGAVYHRNVDVTGAGFADYIAYGTTVEDCYAVYAPYASAVNQSGDNGWRYGAQGGFVRRTSIGYNADDLPIARCFALWPLSKPNSNAEWISGAFCGVTPYNTSTHYFEDCYRPEESAIGDCKNADAEGVEALSLAEFATATAATMPNYDFENVWHAPAAVGASSPYLDASVDENGDFWFFAGVIGAEGRILVNGEEPKEAYPAGAVLTVEAIADNPEMPFAGWIGDGFADPSAQATTYTVKNVSAIAAQFCTPIYTVDDWTNMVHGIAGDSFSGTEAFALMKDLDFTDYIEKNGWNYVSPSGFCGKFFGQGHTIRGLVSTNGYFSNTRALFGKISNGAEIRDLTVESAVYPGSGINNDYNTVCMAGLVCEVGSGSLISNCHTRVDCHGQFPPWAQERAYSTSMYYGLARNVNGTGIRILDCTAEGTMVGCSEVAGLIGYADITDSEIARCSATGYFCATNNRSMPHGRVSGLVGEITLRGGSTVRECFAAGIVDGAYYASGFAYKIELCDDQSTVRDCYSTAEVVTREGGGINDYGNATGFAQRIDDNNDEGGVTVANCWFGGTARALSGEHGHSYGFAWLLSGDVAFQNCAFVQSGDAAEQMEDPSGVTAIAKGARLSAASWAGYDIGGTWTMEAGKTTPYFAWSLVDGGFRSFAMDEEPGTTISHPGTAEPGSDAPAAADAEVALVLDEWKGAADYADVHAPETTFLADNHRTLRCTWKEAEAPNPEVTQQVQFSGNGGTPSVRSHNYIRGGKYDPLPTATHETKSFAGWFALPEGGARITAATTVSAAEARTFHAHWADVTSEIELDRQGGEGGASSVTAVLGEPMPDIAVPSRTGYDFAGYWSATNGGGVRYYAADGRSAHDWDQDSAATLYAAWTARTFTVTLDPNGGIGGTESVVATFGAAMPAISVPEKDDCAFAGYWLERMGGATQYYAADGTGVRTWDVATNETLAARWTDLAVPSAVFRFYSKAYKGHFFTISEEEKQTLIDTNPNWKYEGVAYRAYTNAAPGTTALYRFYSKGYRGHFFTIDADEAETVKHNPNWKYEGIAYYVYPDQVAGSVPVFRFWSKGYRHHFYTTDEAEKDNLIATNPNWKYEGIAFYAVPAEETRQAGAVASGAPGRRALPEAKASANGGACGALVPPEAGSAGRARSPNAPSAAGVAPAWTLAADGGAAVAVPGTTEVGAAVVETRADAPDADELSVAARSENAPSRSGDDDPVSDDAPLALRLALPDGAFAATLWSAEGGMVAEETGAEGAFDFELPATGAWHWLRVVPDGLDGSDGSDDLNTSAFSVWLRAE